MAAIAVRTLANSGDKAISVEESIVQDTQMAATTITAGTAVKEGVLDGFNLDALAYGARVYSGASGVVDTAGTVVVGEVIPARSHLRGNAPDKLLYVNCVTA